MTAILERLATVLDHRLSRRGFVAKSALAGTAMAVAPTDFMLKPVGAYQAICSCAGAGCACGSACCDGYTEFCCTLTGMNRCPPGHLLGGWWKVDNSAFCTGAPRYYLDCNAPCNGCGCGPNGICAGSCSGTGCGCARGDCAHRRSGCVNFRYGQCNQETSCIGPIVCRVVTCVPPWTLDESCTRTLAVDEYTRNHTAPCLHRPFGYLQSVTPSPNGFRLIGWAVDPDVVDPLELHVYANGQVVAWVVADGRRPDVAAAFPGAGERHGFDVEVAVPEGSYDVAVYAINRHDGTEHPVIGSAPVGVGVPFGTFEVQAGPDYVRVVGWTIDPDVAGGHTQLHVYVDGQFAGAWDANVPTSDVAAAWADYGTQHGFDVQIPVGPGPHVVQGWVINDGGADAPRLLGERSITIGGSAVGALDGAFRSPAGVRVVGWALDPDSTEPLDIHIYVDDVFAGAGLGDRPRPDVASLYPNFGANHGYDVEVQAAPGTRKITTYAIGKGGGAPYSLLGTTVVQVGNLPFGWLEATWDDPAGVRCIGWCIDPDQAGPLDLHVYIDGVFAGAGRTQWNRPDVAAGYPAYAEHAGFDFIVAAPVGVHTVCVYVINAGAGDSNPLLGCRTIPLT